MTNKNDKIAVEFSIATLEAEASKGGSDIEPLKVALKDNVVITFKNPQDLGIFDLLDFADEGEDANVTALLEKILSEEDYAALRKYNPNAKVLGLLMERVTKHYGGGAVAPKSEG